MRAKVSSLLDRVIRGGRQSGLDKCVLTERLHRHAGGRRALSDGVTDDGEATDHEDDRNHI